MKKLDKEKRDNILAHLAFIAIVSSFIGLAFLVKKCEPEREHDELYDEYLEEKYDGMERYDPF